MADNSGFWKRQFNIWVLPIVLIGGIIAGHIYMNAGPIDGPSEFNSTENGSADGDGAVTSTSASTEAPPPKIPKLAVNKFELVANFKPPILTVSLDTDLPADTEVSVWASRSYTKEGTSNRFPIQYDSIRTTVGELRDPIQFKIDHAAWMRELNKVQADSSRYGFPFQVQAIEPVIRVTALGPRGRSTLEDGRKVLDLSGKAVSEPSPGWPEVTRKVSVQAPVALPAGVTRRAPNLDPFNLDLNVDYLLAERVPVLRVPNPKDAMRELERGVYAPVGSMIRINTIRSVSDVRWYRVTVFGEHGNRIADGWVSSTALFGQKLRHN